MALTITEAQAELIRYALSSDTMVCVRWFLIMYPAPCSPTTFLTSCDAPTAANWPSTLFACPAASRQSVRAVCLLSSSYSVCPVNYISLTNCSGHSNLPTACPVCEHSPLSSEDCLPHKSLRTTIKVFLRTAEKKREIAKPKEIPVVEEPAAKEPEAAEAPAESQAPAESAPAAPADAAADAENATKKDEESKSEDVVCIAS